MLKNPFDRFKLLLEHGAQASDDYYSSSAGGGDTTYSAPAASAPAASAPASSAPSASETGVDSYTPSVPATPAPLSRAAGEASLSSKAFVGTLSALGGGGYAGGFSGKGATKSQPAPRQPVVPSGRLGMSYSRDTPRFANDGKNHADVLRSKFKLGLVRNRRR